MTIEEPRDARPRRRRVVIAAGLVALVVVAVAVFLVLAGRNGDEKPDATINAYLAAWGKEDWPVMAALVDQPPADFAATHQRVVEDLQLGSAGYQPGTIRRHRST
ncbi:MAG TPA: hypothetical protein VLL25_05915, partial [Acidimicrobiales bacterium]|nr:hypothetical protein [Acidimicrobiales bacterium]